MELRETIKQKPAIGIAVGMAFVALAAAVLASMYWPEPQADLSQAYYSSDDGQTWFADSATRAAPFDQDGKPAMIAYVYSYADGSKTFCGYLAKYTPEAKTAMEASIATAVKAGKPPEAAALLGDREFMKRGILVKKPGDKDWVPYGDPRANAVFTIKSPDGSPVDQVMVQ